MTGPGDGLRFDVLALWSGFRPAAEARVAVIEAALRALDSGTLDEATRAGAEREAHCLTGSLGTYGLPHGSELARAIEAALVGPTEASERLHAWTDALRRAIADGPGPLASAAGRRAPAGGPPHLAPGAMAGSAGGPAVEAHHAPPGIELAVAEVLEQHHQEQHGQVPEAWVDAE